jgi:dihydroorotase
MGADRIIGRHGMEPLRRAIAVADAVGLPVMAHIGNCGIAIADILGTLRAGDIVTHCFAGSANTLVEQGALVGEALEARGRGVLFDIGHGTASFSFDTAEAAAAAGFMPDTISTDIHALSAEVPVGDLPTTMSKLLALGMPLHDVLASVTVNPAAAIGMQSSIGRLEIGGVADIAVFRLLAAPTTVYDANGAPRTIDVVIRVDHTIRGGIPWDPVAYPGRGRSVLAD